MAATDYDLTGDRHHDAKLTGKSSAIPQRARTNDWPIWDDLLQSSGIGTLELEQWAEARLVWMRWPQGVCCPRPECGSADVQEVANRKPMPYRCRSCRRHFSAKSGTPLQSWKISCSMLLAAAHLLAAQLPDMTARRLADCLGTTEKTARRLRRLLQQVVADEMSPGSSLPTGEVAADLENPEMLAGMALTNILGFDNRGVRLGLGNTVVGDTLSTGRELTDA